MEVMNPNADYGNWVPAKMLRASGILSAAGFTCCAAGAFTGNAALAIPCIAIGTAGLCFTVYMKKCSNLFDFKKGGMMGKMHEYLLEHLIWNGKGRILDIGCGRWCTYAALCKAVSKCTAYRRGLLGCGMELCQGTVREKLQNRGSGKNG